MNKTKDINNKEQIITTKMKHVQMFILHENEINVKDTHQNIHTFCIF